MNAITASNIKNIRRRLQNAIDDIATEMNMKIAVGKITYTEEGFTSRITAVVDGGRTDKEKAYDERAIAIGLPDRGTALTIDGVVWEPVGWNRRAPKYPVLLRNLDGVTYRFTLSAIRRAKIV